MKALPALAGKLEYPVHCNALIDKRVHVSDESLSTAWMNNRVEAGFSQLELLAAGQELVEKLSEYEVPPRAESGLDVPYPELPRAGDDLSGVRLQRHVVECYEESSLATRTAQPQDTPGFQRVVPLRVSVACRQDGREEFAVDKTIHLALEKECGQAGQVKGS